MRSLKDLISRFLPRSQRSEFQVADEASKKLLHLLAGPAKLYAFNFRSIPLKPEIQPMLGFLAAASDVLAQDLGGAPAGLGSINATLRIYQALFDEKHTEALMESTFELYREAPESFETGRTLGITFAASLLQHDTDKPARIMVHLLSDRYRSYCGNPDGIDRSA